MDDLIALARLPLAQVPRIRLRDWPAVMRGTLDTTGVPIPVEELAFAEIWRPVIADIGPARAKMAATELLDWLFAAHTTTSPRPLVPLDFEASMHLIEAYKPISDLFSFNDNALNFRAEISTTERREVTALVARTYRPEVAK